MANENIMVGTKAIAKVGRNTIKVEVIALEDNGAYRVRNGNGKEFFPRRLDPMPIDVAAEPAQQIIIPQTASAESEISESDETPNSAPESVKPETAAKRLSLMNAAVEILRRCEQPLKRQIPRRNPSSRKRLQSV